MIKRLIDIIFSFFGLFFFMPILLPSIFLVWYSDKKNPLYIAPRVGKNEIIFNMIKLRTMVIDADKAGIDSTSNNDTRITLIGKKIRKYKIDELTQLYNVLLGDMSLVGPRPNVKSETDNYTKAEKKLLSVKPGITDLASIVFSDEGNILEGKEDPDLAYNQLIRPWKSRLGVIYIENQSFFLDLQIIFFTGVAIISKQLSLSWVCRKLKKLEVSKDIIEVSKRKSELVPHFPLGSDKIINHSR